jgi:uncharacterized protein (DUF1778 family)
MWHDSNSACFAGRSFEWLIRTVDDRTMLEILLEAVMLTFDDKISRLEGPKDARMELRTKKAVKDMIQHAAMMSGVDASVFALNAAYKAALETVNSYETTVLTPADRKVFFDALDNPAEPTPALIEAFERHKRLVISDE